MKISIITPCFNAERFIEETIESVIFQRGNFEIEYIIVDGGSKDSTISIINKYKDFVASRSFQKKCNAVSIVFLSGPDNGMYDALAKGLRHLTGDVVAYINADDFYLPNAFSVVERIFSSYADVQWITGMSTGYNEQGQLIVSFTPFKYDSKLIRRGLYGTTTYTIQQESTFWRRELMNTLDINALRAFRLAGDFFLWHSFSKLTELHPVQAGLGGFRIHPSQLSKSRRQYTQEFLTIAEKKNIFDSMKAHYYKTATKYFPTRLKRTLNSNYIWYNYDVWKKG